MDIDPLDRKGGPEAPEAPHPWVKPRVEVISLSCEITAYAPDDQPLF
jgi:hypothetical protein